MEVCTQKRKTVQKFSKRQRHVDSQRSADDVTGPGRKGCRVAGDGCSGVSMSGGWMRRHVADVFVKKSVQMQLRSRAAFKLMQIDARHHILLPKGADRHVKVVSSCIMRWVGHGGGGCFPLNFFLGCSRGFYA